MGLLRTGFLKEMLQLLFFDHSYYGDSNETFFFFAETEQTAFNNDNEIWRFGFT